MVNALLQLVLATVLIVATVGCGRAQRERNSHEDYPTGNAMGMHIQSSVFSPENKIPLEFTGDGEDRSPSLSWDGVPATARQLALILEDSDVPTPQPWVHWLIDQLPANIKSLPAGISRSGELKQPAGARQGSNSWNKIGYRGPAPAKGHGVHHYHFTLYALDVALDLPVGLAKSELKKALDGHVLVSADLVGTYSR